MKKFLVFVLFLLLLCGCQKEEEGDFNRKAFNRNDGTTTPEPEEPTKAAPGWTITYVTATPRPAATNTPTPTPTMIPYEMTEEILAAEEFSGKVQIADKVFQFPCRLDDVMELSGITLEQSQYSALQGYDPLNDTYGTESSNELHMIFPDGSEAWLTVENLSLRSLPLEELYITELVSESPCIFFPKGVHVGTHCSVLKEWREHDSLVTSSYVGRYIYQEAEYSMNYGTLDLGAEFEIDVNNTTYNIDEITYVPAFYADMTHMTEMIQTNYPKNLKYSVPAALRKGWRTGLIIYEGRQYVVALATSYLYDNPQNKEELLTAMGREMEYYNEEWDSWYYWLDTSDITNEKIVVKEDDVFVSVVNFWDYSDCSDADSITLDDKQMRPRKDVWKAYADVVILSDDFTYTYTDVWKFTLEALDHGEIPEEVQDIFRQVVLTMAESVEIYEK